jgi:toxin FitB
VILLDTNVISELARPTPHSAVIRWAQSLPAARFCTASVCEAEILAGIALMPAGRRQAEIAEAMRAALRTVIGGRVLAFDRAAAEAYAEIAARRRTAGQSIGTFDQLIAAVAVARKLEAIATRNTAHFERCGVPLIDPWQTR